MREILRIDLCWIYLNNAVSYVWDFCERAGYLSMVSGFLGGLISRRARDGICARVGGRFISVD